MKDKQKNNVILKVFGEKEEKEETIYVKLVKLGKIDRNDTGYDIALSIVDDNDKELADILLLGKDGIRIDSYAIDNYGIKCDKYGYIKIAKV